MKAPVFASISSTGLTDEEKRVLKALNPVGITFFKRNIACKTQLKALSNDLKNLLGEEILLAVDQEGGRVRRLAEPDWQSYASQYVLSRLPKDVTKAHCALIAGDLKESGLNFNYAPVLDTLFPDTHPVLKSRCFATNCAELGKIAVKTYCENGVCPCIKHIPGHGRAKSDPHLGLPVITAPLGKLRKDFAPFKVNNDAPAAMTAHILLQDIDDLPVTMSKKAISELIRGEIGFNGLLISDAVDMKALKGSLEEKTLNSLAAGCDAVCYCSGKIDDLYKLKELHLSLNDSAEQKLDRIYKIVGQESLTKADYELYAAKIGSIEAYSENYDATEVLNLMQKNA
ncbi:MAG: glycoside hydrolase family 3 protein [Alphaproteobacteria bacterium]|nr:glycoside hydrolase family 3 protein [Alphaproteobacteria bacterium]